MKGLFVALVLIGLCRPTGTALAQTAAQPTAQPAASTINSLNPGDVLRITVWRKPELSGEFIIATDGTVSHPLYRSVRVTGIPLSAVETRIRDFLGTLEENPQFVVEPLLRVAVAGEVRQPNVYNLRPETSLAQAVAIAGGTTDRGRRDRVVLVRDNRDAIVNLRKPDQTGAGMLVRSGDQIVVERESRPWDTVGPIVSILGATAAIVSVILYNGRR
jgi:polysaccharide export outer membrane protein